MSFESMLETTLATQYIPATNLQGDLVSADWRFLLPSLQLEEVLCLGTLSVSNLKVLATLGRKIIVVSTDRMGLEELASECQNMNLDKLQMIPVADYLALPFVNNTFSLIHLSKGSITKKFLCEPDLKSHLNRLLRSNGIIHYELRHFSERRHSRRTTRDLNQEGMGAPSRYWLTPFSGEMRTALPLRESAISYFFFKNVIYGQSFKKRALSRIGRSFSRLGFIDYVVPRRAVFLQRGIVQQDGRRPPQFLIDLAGQAGIDFSSYRFGLSTRGKFNANKVIYFLFKKSQSTPEIIIKMTRSPEFNYRLENEYRVLSCLRENRYIPSDSYPQPLFFDKHHDLAVLAQKAVQGEPFRTRTKATPDCPHACAAIDRIFQLAEASCVRSLVTNKEVAFNLGKLFDRFVEIYPVARHEGDFIATQLQAIEECSCDMPLVFQHGDPGTWNILVSERRKVIFIDWEAGEPKGMPLWDLLYFMRTYASWALRKQGSRDALWNFSQNFLNPSPFSSLLVDLVKKYCQRLDLDEQLIRPLFFTCWMHRSLKEAARLTEATLSEGHYYNTLKLCIEKKDTPALQSLFTLNTRGQFSDNEKIRNQVTV